jgi:hypothetical protein
MNDMIENNNASLDMGGDDDDDDDLLQDQELPE